MTGSEIHHVRTVRQTTLKSPYATAEIPINHLSVIERGAANLSSFHSCQLILAISPIVIPRDVTVSTGNKHSEKL